MDASRPLSARGRFYVHGVIAIGAAVLVAAVADLPQGPEGYYFEWLVLAALTAISGSATVRLPSIPASLSVSETFVFTSVLLFGAPAATLTVALDGLIISLWLSRKRKELHRLLFNIAAPAISIWIASQVFFALAGIEPIAYGNKNVEVREFLLPLVAFTLLFFTINSWMIAFAVALETGAKPFQIWRTNFMWLSLNFFCGASLAAMLAVNVDPKHVDLTYLGAVVPLLLVLYVTYRTAMARVEDANHHLKRVNQLHLATIETLAHAVDAKDQVTHGHIRRVQNMTTQVAVALGVKDDLQLKAIEASALLHDMGKLAIPEHILNKPGKLTEAEFEKMKLHASIGAEILSSIEFPYPVVPIVRHHHENWNGTGYPDGISGVDIPIGARILSVVDCFDALTSDRPYRPALTIDAAMDIVRQRRGSMYDPLIVDTFIKVHERIVSPPVKELDRLVQRMAVAADVPRAEAVAPSQHGREKDSLAFLRLLQLFGEVSEDSWDEVGDLVLHRLRSLIDFTDCALFVYENGGDELSCRWSTGGAVGGAINGLKLKRGEGVSGWVAANKRSILNSPAALDILASGAGVSLEQPGVSLSVPLLHSERLVGVLTLYKQSEPAFSETEQQILESIASAVTRIVARSQLFGRSTVPVNHEYPTAHHLDAFLRRKLYAFREKSGDTWLLVIQDSGEDTTPETGRTIARQVGGHLRGGDMVFVCDSRTVVCVLASGTEREALNIAQRLVQLIRQKQPLRGSNRNSVSAGLVAAPRDGTTLAGLLEAADRRSRRAVA